MNEGSKVTERNKENIPYFLDRNPQEEVIAVPMAKYTHELILRQEKLLGKIKRKMNV